MAIDNAANGTALALLALAEAPPAANLQPAAAPAEAGATGEDVLARAQTGDRAAWEELIARHQHKVLVSLLARGILLDRARDIAQEAWTRLITSARAGRLTSLQLPGLAIVQAGYLAGSDWRRRSRELPAAAPVPGGRTASGNPESQLLGREAVQRLSTALAACPDSARRVFELCYQQPELGYDQVAAQVGLSTQRVKQIVCEVRKRLRTALEEIR